MIRFKNFLSKTNQEWGQFRHSWVKPDGLDTGIKLYNCITRTKESLILRNKNLIKWYTCGPTVYDSSHVGHASCYVKLDVIQRILRGYFNYNVVTVMNVTDIDDKIIKKALYDKTDYKTLAEKYEEEFWTDLKDLGVVKPDVKVRVTEKISLIVDFIRKLESQGLAYKSKDNSVYFDVTSYSSYGKLQNVNEPEEFKSEFKRSPLDFALWKSSKEGEPYWSSPWGTGRPGWHIECSALASNIFGSDIDIHAGGIDLRFPHHENEEAQSCAYHDIPQWVNYWMHVGHLRLSNEEKMSKSLGNTVSIREMLKTTSPEVFRMACVMSPYRGIMDYSSDLLTTARNNFKIYENFFSSCGAYRSGFLKGSLNNDVLLAALNKSSEEIGVALRDDFDTPKVVKSLHDLVSVVNSMLLGTASSDDLDGLSAVVSIEHFVRNIFDTFGINFEANCAKSEDFNGIVDILNDFRQSVRVIGLGNKDVNILERCDTVRENLKGRGIVIKDHGKVSSWSISK